MNQNKLERDFKYILFTMGEDELKGYISFVENQILELRNDLKVLGEVCSNPDDETKVLLKKRIENEETLIRIANEVLHKYNKQ